MNGALAWFLTDGTIAAIFVALGLSDMTVNHCPTECFAQSQAQEALSIQASRVIFQQELISTEYYVGYDTDRRYGPFQITYGAAVTEGGDTWIGVGVKMTTQDLINSPFFLEGSILPGLYARRSGPDLSTPLQFRSAIGVGYAFDSGASLTLFVDHRSNGDTQHPNPGIETVGIRYAVALN